MKLTDDEEINARIVIRQALAKKCCLPLDVVQMDAIVQIVLPAMMVPVMVSPLAKALDAYIATGRREEIQACPFCGSANVGLPFEDRPCSWVTCHDCGADGPLTREANDDQAKANWNRRESPCLNTDLIDPPVK